MSLTIYYDGECPFCTHYVTMLRLRRTVDVRLIDLRDNPEASRQLEAAGFDLDQGMVVQDQGRSFGGAAAVTYLAALSTPSDLLNRLNRTLFSHRPIARVLYPVLRSGRWLTLFLLDRRMIEDREDSSRARRELFTVFFSLFSIFHFFNYAFEYGRIPPGWDLILVLVAACVALFRPASTRALFGLMLVSTISTIVQAPIQSNHTIVRAGVLLAYWLSFAVAMARNDRISKIFERFAPGGCGVLLVLYFFGIFHKINADFLNPATSCAVALWRQMPAPLSMLSGPIIEFGSIYGTFLVEGLIALALVTRKYRHVGVAAGITFHLLLSLSSYAMYISFTMLALALHTLFLNENASRSILSSPLPRVLRSKLDEPIYKLLVAGLAIWLAAFAFGGDYTFASVAVFPLVLPFCWAVLRHGGHPGPYVRRWQTLSVGAMVTVLFFINCAMPYMGLKTAQAGNMFANLRLEGGESNHLVFTSPPKSFGYLDQVAVITDAGGDPDLGWLATSGMGIVYYDLLAKLHAHPGLTVSFAMDGRQYNAANAASLRREIYATLHPSWFRKYFHFQPVSLQRPEHCNV